MQSKLLKPYKGFIIEKSWENKDGVIKKDSVVYTAYDSDNDSFDSCATLNGLKKSIDKYIS